jgi:type VI secretion system FHA domain protein
MALVLRVLVAGDCSIAEGDSRVCDGSTFTIGRGPENDWVVTDPQRHLSKQHCRIELRGRTYFVIDTSTNGVFMAGAATPLGRGNAQPVNDGDVINLGPCTLRLEIGGQAAQAPAMPTPASSGARLPAFGEPEGHDLASSPFPSAITELPVDDVPSSGEGDRGALVSQILSGESLLELPLASMLAERHEQGATPGFDEDQRQSSHYASTNAHFQPPEVARPMIPVDWHVREPAGLARAKDDAVGEVSPRPMARAPRDLPPEPAPAELPRPEMKPSETVAPKPAVPSPPVPGDLLASFLAGVGLPADAVDPAEAPAVMHKLGLAFREAVGGLRELLELRAFLKSEFRIEHTLLRAKENNPLKFSANVDGALAVLIGRRVTGFMDAPEAIRESLRDVKAHEVALIAGMKTVIGDVLEQLSPEAVKSTVGSAVLPQMHKARCWTQYEQIHQRLAGEQSSGPPLGGQFSKAYTRQFRSI